MAHITLPEPFRAFVGPGHHDAHWIDVRLLDGRVYRNLIVRGGIEITGRAFPSPDDSPLPFEASDIAEVRPQAMFLPIRWWFSRPKGSPAISASTLAVLFALAILALTALIMHHGTLALPSAAGICVIALLIGLRRQ